MTYDHDETEWLRLTALSKYPDSVVALTRHMLWQENLAEQELEHAPDLVVTARRAGTSGSRPRSARRTDIRLPIRCGRRFSSRVRTCGNSARIEEPCRLADLTPTILDMIGYRVETGDFDGHPLRNIYQTAAAEAPTTQRVVHTDDDAPETRPVYWDDVDLKAWKKLDPALRPEYEHRPLTVNHPNSPCDIQQRGVQPAVDLGFQCAPPV